MRPQSATAPPVRPVWMVAILVCLCVLTGCERGGEPRPQTLTVFGASSMTDALEAVGASFEQRHPGVDVEFSFAGSQALRAQIEQGAPADVYVSADPAHVDALAQAGLVEAGRVVAHNALVVVVPADNPAGIEAFADLPKAERIVLGAAEVPAGRYADAILAAASGDLGDAFGRRVYARVVSREPNVRLALAKVTLGEADAAIVYRTDALAASERAERVPIPPAYGRRADYPAAVVASTDHPQLAGAFVDYLRSPSAQSILARHGFEAVDAPTDDPTRTGAR